MSDIGGRLIRGSRPSRYGSVDGENDEAELVRLANIELYAKRARAGQPIFEDQHRAASSLGASKQLG